MTKGLDIAALVLSLLFFIPPLPIVGLILGIVSVARCSKKKEKASGLAIAAIIVGAITSVLSILAIIALIWGFVQPVG